MPTQMLGYRQRNSDELAQAKRFAIEQTTCIKQRILELLACRVKRIVVNDGDSWWCEQEQMVNVEYDKQALEPQGKPFAKQSEEWELGSGLAESLVFCERMHIHIGASVLQELTLMLYKDTLTLILWNSYSYKGYRICEGYRRFIRVWRPQEYTH